jgi:hypothetical protein
MSKNLKVSVRIATPVQKNKETINTNKEDTVFCNELQPVLPMSPIAEQLRFHFIISSNLGFIVYKLYINTMIQFQEAINKNIIDTE